MLSQYTQSLPQVFALIEVKQVLNIGLHYIIVYDSEYRIARITNYSNYTEKAVNKNGHSLICCEIPLATSELNQQYRFDEEDICREITRILGVDPSIIESVKFIEVSSTYKIELNGFSHQMRKFVEGISEIKNSRNVLFPEGALLTRKEAMDSLRSVSSNFFTL